MEIFDEAVRAFILERKEVVGGIVAFLLLWYAVHRFRVNRRPFRAASTENGSVFVSRATVLNLVQSACSEIEGGSVKRVHCTCKRQSLLLKLYVSLDVNQSFEVASTRFQEAARNAVTHCLGALKTVRVDVILEGTEGTYIDSGKSVGGSGGSFGSVFVNKSAVFSEDTSVLSSKTGADAKDG